ncbi:hypothetical protein ACTFIU_006924 [Dictyostelium citrinum]
MSTTRDIKLNCFIFKEISIFLIYKNSFESILELSLLSKLAFKIFQNQIISNELNQYNFFLTFKQLKDYIDKGRNDIDEHVNYKYKLIQYKHIEFIRFPFLYDKPFQQMGTFKSNPWSGISGEYINEQNKETKKYLNKYCPSLKYVKVGEMVQTFLFDLFSCDDFFKIKRLNLLWTLKNPPLSHLKNLDDEEKLIKEKSLKDDLEFLSNHNYSFNFLKSINPIKIYLNNSYGDFHIHNFNNLLNCKSIKTIKFWNAFVPMNFIENVINNNFNSNIKSFQISFPYVSSNICRSQPVSPLDANHFPKEFIQVLSKKCENKNFNLKRLIIGKKNQFQFELYNNDNDNDNDLLDINDFNLLINLLNIKLPNLSTLGLEFFFISSFDLLSPLDEIKNLNTLACNIKSLHSITQYCIKNKNIKKVILPLNGDYVHRKQQFEIFEWLLSVSEQTELKVIKIILPILFSSEASRLRDSFQLNNKNSNLKLDLCVV